MNDELRPLTQKQRAFIDAYMKHGNATQARIDAGYANYKTPNSHAVNANRLLKKANVAAEIHQRQEAMKKDSIATAQDVMEFFTKAMNGEIKDQFGLDATLGDRIKAGQELAKRTIDLENRMQGKADAKVEIVVNWNRKKVDKDAQ